MDEIPSCYYIINLCVTIFDHIFEHLINKVFVRERDIQWELETQLETIHRYLDLLKREIRNDIRINLDYPVSVLRLHFTRPAIIDLPELNQIITWDLLSTVDIKILFDFMHRLIGESLISMVPHMPNLSGHRLESMEGYIMLALINAENEVKTYLESRGREVPNLPRFLSFDARLKIEIHDHRRGITVIFPPDDMSE